jgi:hypothetical protein
MHLVGERCRTFGDLAHSSLLSFVEALVRFENHLHVWVVEDNFESPQHLGPDGPSQAWSGKNARTILGELRGRISDNESPESDSRHPTEPGTKVTAHRNDISHVGRLRYGQKFGMCFAERLCKPNRRRRA